MGRFARTLALVSVAVAVAGLGGAFGVWSWRIASILAIVAVAGIALAHRHLADLDALRQALDNLLKGRIPASTRRPMLGVVADAADRIALLGRQWREREDALEAAKAIDQAVFEAIPDPLVLVDRSRRVIRANAAMRDLFGSTIADSQIDTVLRNPVVLDAIDEALAGRAAQAVSLNIPGTPERNFNVRIASFGGGGGPFVLVALYDATAIRHAERMRADFVANVSHELRTPLSALLGFIETLRGPARDDIPARERFLAIMNEQASRMTRLVNDLLSLSKIEESEHNPPVQSVALAPILGSVADALNFQARAKGMTIALDVAPDLPSIVGDADQLVQVFQNLIDNAIKYGRAQTTVRVSVKKSQGAAGNIASGQVIAVAIADEGDGIPREHLPRLTERFYRVDAGRSRQLGGTGLGLAIVKHIVNRHRGALTIESEQGRGTTVTVYLPIAAKS